jgi:OmpA-OmpF porin, OOP family
MLARIQKESLMKKLIALAIVAAAFSTSTFAQSVGNMYGDVSYGMVNVKDTSAVDSAGTFKTIVGRLSLGSVVADNLAVEGFITQGLAGDSKLNNGVIVDVKNKTSYGIAVRPFIQATQDIEVFGRLGTIRSEFEVTATANGRSASSKTTNTLYGVGVAYKINKDMSAVIDYTRLSNKDNTTISLVSVGARFNF